MADPLTKSSQETNSAQNTVTKKIVVKKYNGECLATCISNITNSVISQNKSELKDDQETVFKQIPQQNTISGTNGHSQQKKLNPSYVQIRTIISTDKDTFKRPSHKKHKSTNSGLKASFDSDELIIFRNIKSDSPEFRSFIDSILNVSNVNTVLLENDYQQFQAYQFSANVLYWVLVSEKSYSELRGLEKSNIKWIIYGNRTDKKEFKIKVSNGVCLYSNNFIELYQMLVVRGIVSQTVFEPIQTSKEQKSKSSPKHMVLPDSVETCLESSVGSLNSSYLENKFREIGNQNKIPLKVTTRIHHISRQGYQPSVENRSYSFSNQERIPVQRGSDRVIDLSLYDKFIENNLTVYRLRNTIDSSPDYGFAIDPPKKVSNKNLSVKEVQVDPQSRFDPKNATLDQQNVFSATHGSNKEYQDPKNNTYSGGDYGNIGQQINPSRQSFRSPSKKQVGSINLIGAASHRSLRQQPQVLKENPKKRGSIRNQSIRSNKRQSVEKPIVIVETLEPRQQDLAQDESQNGEKVLGTPPVIVDAKVPLEVEPLQSQNIPKRISQQKCNPRNSKLASGNNIQPYNQPLQEPSNSSEKSVRSVQVRQSKKRFSKQPQGISDPFCVGMVPLNHQQMPQSLSDQSTPQIADALHEKPDVSQNTGDPINSNRNCPSRRQIVPIQETETAANSENPKALNLELHQLPAEYENFPINQTPFVPSKKEILKVSNLNLDSEQSNPTEPQPKRNSEQMKEYLHEISSMKDSDPKPMLIPKSQEQDDDYRPIIKVRQSPQAPDRNTLNLNPQKNPDYSPNQGLWTVPEEPSSRHMLSSKISNKLENRNLLSSPSKSQISTGKSKKKLVITRSKPSKSQSSFSSSYRSDEKGQNDTKQNVKPSVGNFNEYGNSTAPLSKQGIPIGLTSREKIASRRSSSKLKQISKRVSIDHSGFQRENILKQVEQTFPKTNEVQTRFKKEVEISEDYHNSTTFQPSGPILQAKNHSSNLQQINEFKRLDSQTSRLFKEYESNTLEEKLKTSSLERKNSQKHGRKLSNLSTMTDYKLKPVELPIEPFQSKVDIQKPSHKRSNTGNLSSEPSSLTISQNSISSNQNSPSILYLVDRLSSQNLILSLQKICSSNDSIYTFKTLHQLKNQIKQSESIYDLTFVFAEQIFSEKDSKKIHQKCPWAYFVEISDSNSVDLEKRQTITRRMETFTMKFNNLKINSLSSLADAIEQIWELRQKRQLILQDYKQTKLINQQNMVSAEGKNFSKKTTFQTVSVDPSKQKVFKEETKFVQTNPTTIQQYY